MVLVVGGNETQPTNVVLKCHSAVAILIGNLYIANIMGSLVDYVSVISRRDNIFQERLDIANMIMHEIDVSEETQESVRDFFFSTRMSLEQQEELITFKELISPSLK